MLHRIAQTDADLAAVFSRWYKGTTEHMMHYDSAYTKINAKSGVDQGCPLSTCDFSTAVDSNFGQFGPLHTGRFGRQTLRLAGRLLPVEQTAMLPTDNCCYHSSHQISQLCPTVCQDTGVTSLLAGPHSTRVPSLGGHLQIHDDIEPSLVVFGDRSRPFGPNLSSATVLLRCFFYLLIRRTWSGLCSSTPCCRPMARVAVDHSHINGNNPVTGHRFSLRCNITTKITTGATPIHPFNTNEQTSLPTQTTWSSLSPTNHSEETSLHHPKKHTQTTPQQPHRHTH